MIQDLRALPGAAQSLILIAAGVLAFVLALVLIRTGVVSWDEGLFTMLNTGTGSGSVGAKVVSAITTPIALVILVVGRGSPSTAYMAQARSSSQPWPRRSDGRWPTGPSS